MRSPSIESAPAPALRLQAQLEAHARWRRWLQRKPLLALASTLALALVFVAWRCLQADGDALLARLEAQPIVVAIASFALGWNLIRKARQRAQKASATSWLATTPIDACEILAATRRQVAWHALPVFAAILAVPLMAMAASATGASQTLALIGGGFAAGALAGWRAGAQAKHSAATALPRLSPPRATTLNAASLAALARWPFARLLADANPRLHAHLVAGTLLMLPMGMPLWVALLIVLLAASAIAACTLLQALLATIADAAGWVRAIPLPLGAFTRMLCLRSGLVLVATILLDALLLLLLGVSRVSVFVLASVALAWCVTAVGHALASRRHPERARGERVILALAMFVLLGSAGWLLFLALPIVWLRDGWRATRP